MQAAGPQYKGWLQNVRNGENMLLPLQDATNRTGLRLLSQITDQGHGWIHEPATELPFCIKKKEREPWNH